MSILCQVAVTVPPEKLRKLKHKRTAIAYNVIWVRETL